ncbi:MAG: YggT family protein [bacterium]
MFIFGYILMGLLDALHMVLVFLSIAISIRVIVSWITYDRYSPVSRFFYELTEPAVKPFRNIAYIPTRVDVIPIIMVALMIVVDIFLVRGVLVDVARWMGYRGHIRNQATQFINLMTTIYTWIIIARALISWVNPDYRHPVVKFLIRVTEPILRPIRRTFPPMGHVDLSPLVAIVILMFLSNIITGLISYAAIEQLTTGGGKG